MFFLAHKLSSCKFDLFILTFGNVLISSKMGKSIKYNCHRKVQKKCQDELDQVVGRDRRLTISQK